MAKVLEGPGMGLMKKWGINGPNHFVVASTEELTKLGQANDWLKRSKLVVKAHEALGSRFNIKDFHDVVLSAGTVPLTILENEVEAYIRSKQASP